MKIQTVKAYARQRMLGNYGKAISALLTVTALRFIASGLISTIFDTSSTGGLIMNFLATIIMELIGGILTAGLAFVFLKIMYGQDVMSTDVYHAFMEQPDKAVRIMFVLTLTAQLWEIPVSLLMLGRFGTAATFFFVLLALAGFLFYMTVWLTYSMAFYLLQDFPDREVIDLMRMSRELMQGNRTKLLALVCSFLPLFLLGVVTLFLPLLWVSAYMEASRASFYRELMMERRRGTSAGEE